MQGFECLLGYIYNIHLAPVCFGESSFLETIQINRNILFRTPRFMALAFPSSYSIPEAPPSPDICSNRSRSSASASVTVLVLCRTGWRLLSSFERGFVGVRLFCSCLGSEVILSVGE